VKTVTRLVLMLVPFVLMNCASTGSTRNGAVREELNPAIEGVLAINYFAEIDAEDGTESGGPGWVSRSISDFLVSEHTKLDFISVVSRSTIREVLQEQEFALLTGLTEGTTQIGRILEADYLLNGDYQLHEGRLTVNARLIDVETSEIVRAFRATGHESHLHLLQEQILYEFLSFNNVPLRTEELAARDYEPDTGSIRRFFRAEAFQEEGNEGEARRELERLLQENPLYTPAQQVLAGGVRSDGSVMVDGASAIAAADAELRRQIYYGNLARSFALYTRTHGFRVEVLEVDITSEDAQNFAVEVEGRVVLRDSYRQALADFISLHPYLTSESKGTHERFLRRGGVRVDAPELIALRFAQSALPQEENHYGFVRIHFNDARGTTMWRIDSGNVRGEMPVFSAREGERPITDNDPLVRQRRVYVANANGSGMMSRLNAFAAIGGNLTAPFRDGIWIAQVHFWMTVILPREDVAQLAEVTGEPYFGSSRSD
jgi:TolB-like protein